MPRLALRLATSCISFHHLHSGTIQVNSKVQAKTKNSWITQCICSSLFISFHISLSVWILLVAQRIGITYSCKYLSSSSSCHRQHQHHPPTSKPPTRATLRKPSSHPCLIRHPSLPSNALLRQGMDFWALCATSVFPSSAFLLGLLPKDHQEHHNEGQEPGDIW